MRAQELPETFLNSSFTVKEALAAGVSRSRLRAADLSAPTRGVRVPRGADLTLLAQLHAVTALDDATTVSELTAARARGIPLPFWADQRIHLSRTRGGTHPRRTGVIGHRTLLLPGEVEYLAGVRITSAARTWLDLAHHLPLADLVAAGDHLVNEHGPDHPFPRTPLCTPADLRRVTLDHPKMKGKTNALAALELIRPGADSPQETRMRLILLDHGLPEPRLNVILYDSWGKPNVWPDAAYPEHRLSLQYDGKLHDEARQYERDIARAAITAELGWEELRISASDLRGPQPGVVRKVRRALHKSGRAA
ncbi:endonuclease domain-containing protein [Arthrobacter sp. NPDC090010]|uniref:endonuclease domain-containing protein n=1 Tax=Arthrobacter sp. NPDC090010 TaxID=3363942 RepID=UPI0037F7B0A0